MTTDRSSGGKIKTLFQENLEKAEQEQQKQIMQASLEQLDVFVPSENQPQRSSKSSTNKISQRSTQNQPTLQVDDHFTLKIPSSSVRFRNGNSVKIYPGNTSQWILEEDTDQRNRHKMKRVQDATSGLYVLRGWYTLVAIFLLGFAFVFSLCILLFLMTDFAVASGFTELSGFQPLTGIGIFLSVPVYLMGLSDLLVFSSTYVVDTWKGHALWRQTISQTIFLEWFTFAGFLGVPLLVAGVSLFVGNEKWWELSLLTWFCCVLVFWFFYVMTCVWYEVRAAWDLVSSMSTDDQEETPLAIFKRALALRQRFSYGVYETEGYLACSQGDGGPDTPIQSNDATNLQDKEIIYNSKKVHKTCYSWMMQMILPSFSYAPSLMEFPETPEFIPTLADVQGNRFFISLHTWSLDKFYCRPKQQTFIALIEGQDSLTRAQMKSSFACAFVGNGIILFLLIGVLSYQNFGPAMIGIVLAFCVVFWLYPSYRQVQQTWNAVKRINKNITQTKWGASEEKEHAVSELGTESGIEDVQQQYNVELQSEDGKTHQPQIFLRGGLSGSGAASTDQEAQEKTNQAQQQHAPSRGIYYVMKRYRLARPTPELGWFMLSLELGFLFLWPLISLYSLGNWLIATEFLVIAFFTGVRHYLNPAVIVEELGTFFYPDRQSQFEAWKYESRLHDVVSTVTTSGGRRIWMRLYSIFVLGFMVLAFTAVGSESDNEQPKDYALESLNPIPDFKYEPTQSLEYPTCHVGKQFLKHIQVTALLDYAFMAQVAYRDASVTQSELDKWFARTELVVDRQDVVDAYRTTAGSAVLPVSYKLITVGNHTAAVSIRGRSDLHDNDALCIHSKPNFLHLL